jgi:hypothetical protein
MMKRAKYVNRLGKLWRMLEVVNPRGLAVVLLFLSSSLVESGHGQVQADNGEHQVLFSKMITRAS